MRMNLDSRGREVRPVSFLSDGTTVFVMVGGLLRRFVVVRLPLPSPWHFGGGGRVRRGREKGRGLIDG